MQHKVLSTSVVAPRLFSSQKVKTQHGMKLVSDLVDDDEIVEVLE